MQVPAKPWIKAVVNALPNRVNTTGRKSFITYEFHKQLFFHISFHPFFVSLNYTVIDFFMPL